MKVKRLSDLAVIPTKNEGDAGYDLYSTGSYDLGPLERHLFPTNIAMAIPEGFYGRICDRSGKAYKQGLHVMAGVIDSTYRGDIGVVLINLNPLKFYSEAVALGGDYIEVKKGDKIAQIIFRRYYEFEMEESDELPPSTRGENGWGSTGR